MSLCVQCGSRQCRHLDKPAAILSDADLQLLRLVAAGSTNKSAAHLVGTTEGAVKQRLHRIYRRLRMNTEGNARVHLSEWARTHDVLSPDSKAA